MEQESVAFVEDGTGSTESTVVCAAAILVDAATPGQHPHHELNSRYENDVQLCTI